MLRRRETPTRGRVGLSPNEQKPYQSDRLLPLYSAWNRHWLKEDRGMDIGEHSTRRFRSIRQISLTLTQLAFFVTSVLDASTRAIQDLKVQQNNSMEVLQTGYVFL